MGNQPKKAASKKAAKEPVRKTCYEQQFRFVEMFYSGGVMVARYQFFNDEKNPGMLGAYIDVKKFHPDQAPPKVITITVEW